MANFGGLPHVPDLPLVHSFVAIACCRKLFYQLLGETLNADYTERFYENAFLLYIDY